GKLYDEKYEDNQLAQHWEYYLKHEENHHLYPEFDSLEDLKIMDPACGSGHILLYAFDMLYDMYEEAGYPSREIPQLILENNLYGLDIDKRAQQIANFALIMKAAEKQPRFISRLSRKGINPKINVYEIVDADQSLSEEAIDYFVENETEKSLINELMSQFENGKQFGSLINPIELPYEEWMNRINKLENRQNDLIEESYSHELVEKLLPVLKQAYLLYQKYDVVVTNPPYHNKYNPVLKKFMNKEYNDYKTDLYSAFIYKTSLMSKENGYSALMTPYTWMYITSHEKLRETIIENLTISSLVEIEYSAFKEATVQICSFILHNQNNQQLGEFVKLSNFKGAELQPIKVSEAVFNRNVNYRYSKNTGDFGKIPMSPISYFASEKVINIFKTHIKIKDIGEIKKGLDTGGNDAVIRKWYEVVFDKINMQASNIKEFDNSNATFVPFNKGGDYRKWYGNRENVVGYNKNFRKIMSTFKGHRHQNRDYYFREALTFSAISSTNLG